MENYIEVLESGFFKKKWVKRFCRLDATSKRIDIFEDGSLNKDVGTVYLRKADLVTAGIDDFLLQEGLDGNFYCCKIMDNECRKEWFLNFDSKSTMDSWVKAVKKASGSTSKTTKESGDGFSFNALVKSWKKSEDGSHMVYGLHCEMSKISKSQGKRQRKRWILWKRFSEFRALDAKLRKTLGYQIQNIEFPSSSIFTFDKEDVNFLNKRQEGLSLYMTSILGVDKVAVFSNKAHCNQDLREFVEYDIHSKAKKKKKDVPEPNNEDAPEPRIRRNKTAKEGGEKKKKNRRATYAAGGARRSKEKSSDGTTPPPPPPPPPTPSSGSAGVPPPPPVPVHHAAEEAPAPSPVPAPAPAPMPTRPNPFGGAPGAKPNDLLASIRGGATLRKTDDRPTRRQTVGTSSTAPPSMASQMNAALAARRKDLEENVSDKDSDGGDWSDSD